MSITGKRIRELRKSLSMDQAAFARLMGVDQSTISRWETGKDEPTGSNLAKLAEMADVSIQYFIEEHHSGELDSTRTATVRVLGTVAAGNWLEAVEWPPDEQFNVYLPITADMENLEIHGFLVRGSSMNLVYPPGSIVFAKATIKNELDPQDGQRVLVQRRNSKGEYEITVKELRLDEDGSPWLWPLSDDPRHQTPIATESVEDEDIEDVTITGIVVAAIVYESDRST